MTRQPNGGATLVRVPDPARFALHKMIISGRRHITSQAKAEKDRQQAAQIIEVLYEDRRGDLLLAAEGLNKRSRGWRVRLKLEIVKLPSALNSAREMIVDQLLV